MLRNRYWFVLMLVVIVAILALPTQITRVQANPYGTQPTCGNSVNNRLSGLDDSRLDAPFFGGPSSSKAEGKHRLECFSTYVIDVRTVLGVSCEQLRVYRQTQWGDLILHLETACNGDTMTIQAVGTGMYYFYGFGNASNAGHAQISVLLNDQP
jgi:hypothetical protein